MTSHYGLVIQILPSYSSTCCWLAKAMRATGVALTWLFNMRMCWWIVVWRCTMVMSVTSFFYSIIVAVMTGNRQEPWMQSLWTCPLGGRNLTEGYLGDFDPELEPGDIQTFVFGPDNEGPFNLTPAQREAQRHDKDNGGLLLRRNKTWKELGLDLVRGNFMLECNLPKTAKEICEKAIEFNIPLEVLTPNIVEGWQGKPKGLCQVCWERGLLDPHARNSRTMLVELLEECTDFENCKSNLQMIAWKLGVRAERTPKFHCEMAGEGIEYNWAIGKKKYRSIPLIHKKGRQISRILSETSQPGSRCPSWAQKGHLQGQEHTLVHITIYISTVEASWRRRMLNLPV